MGHGRGAILNVQQREIYGPRRQTEETKASHVLDNGRVEVAVLRTMGLGAIYFVVAAANVIVVT